MRSVRSIRWTIVVSSCVLLLVLTSFGGGVLAERYVFQPAAAGDGAPRAQVSSLQQDTATPAVDVDRIEEVLKLLQDEYYYGPVDRNQRLYSALSGMVDSLPDGYTRFEPPQQAQQSREQLSGEYEGIGVWIETRDGKVTLVAPMRDSPPERAGVKPGDVVVAVDGVSVAGLSQDDVVAKIRGPVGTHVRLSLQREGTDGLVELDIERAKITNPSVTYRKLESGYALISVSIFGDKTTAQLDQALKDATRDQVRGIILDLRNNGGGWVNSAQEMIGRFVPADAGPALFEDEHRDPETAAPQPIIAGQVHEFDLPMVVLANGGTASASEIVTGALRDYKRATIIGVKTFGKGSIQRIHPFSDGSSVRITVAEWLTPNRGRIHGEGITPDIEVAADAPSANGDPQLERAVAFLESR
jgi:carboxyl-terminal processing protease